MQQYDLVIIGAGPAGLNAALYASRANLKVAFVEKGAPGGKLSATSKIENWLGTPMVEGWELAQQFFDHAQKYGATYTFGEVVKIEKHAHQDFSVILKDETTLKARSVLIATGMQNRVPTFIENIDVYMNNGVSFCAICDGPIFGKNPTIVLGGGNSAVEEATYLSKIASHVYVVVRDDAFIAEKKLVEELLKQPNVTVFFNSQIQKLSGDKSLEKAHVFDSKTNTLHELEVASFFPYIGMEPKAEFVSHLNITNERGFIKTNEFMETEVEGLFAAGDIRAKDIRQIVTAANDGAIAAKKISDSLA
ncbi:FAD-dependent oxidoreductase [Mycoplasmopsis ciconiae]|uniref:FAD-dependent oxidoreductase n=1 Tax=Mycoplasmopsis ciconiae TaxID=561067 RepID=A0ABU7MM52_9BACT|nr:FAD-dependent oxidoreductase [Mycoplasmopsis ciconiae]